MKTAIKIHLLSYINLSKCTKSLWPVKIVLSNCLMSASRDLKKYIKTSSCYPDRCTKSDYENIMKDFQDSEKVHVMMLVAEAKFQSSLLYAMRAVSEYYNTS